MAFMKDLPVLVAVPALIWSSAVYLVQSIGILMLFRHYSYPPRKAVSPELPLDQVPHVTIIRPVKGLEPNLYECLASSFHQNYPSSKFSVYLCVSSEDDPSYPILEKVVEDFSSKFDVRLFVEEYDPVISSLEGKTGRELGPNPKIRNISRAYREAKGDLIWIIDCNVWISRSVAGRMVDRLMGFLPNGQKATPFRFVHQMPLVVDVPAPATSADVSESVLARAWRLGGGRLDEMFMATTHAKFYGAINTVGVAPCIIGKSNMFRKSHLDTYTNPAHNPNLAPSDTKRGRGIDFFSSYICEDHLIGDLLWKAPMKGFHKHGLVWGDIAIQPVSGVPVSAYWARRVRWLRARKWTVLLATLVEPGVESLLCNLCFSYAATTLPWFHNTVGFPRTWSTMGVLWATGVTIWMVCDRFVYRRLHRCLTVEVDEETPAFARGTRRPGGVKRKPFRQWLPTWIARELLAMPIWTWAVLLGTTVTWRGKSFRVHSDMSVVSLNPEDASRDGTATASTDEVQNGSAKEDKHPEIQEAPSWEGRPMARQRRSHGQN